MDCKVITLIFAVQLHRGVEQLVARRAHNPEVVGSSPASATTKEKSKGFSFFYFSPRNFYIMKKKILFICHGNICRSPMAEFVFKALVRTYGLEDMFYVESAAVSTEEIGNPIYPPAKRCLTQHGVAFDKNKTSRQVTPEDYKNFDLLICMDNSNIRLLKRIIGDEDPDNKVHLMMSYTGEFRDVADPWYTGDFETTFQDVLSASEAFLKMI